MGYGNTTRVMYGIKVDDLAAEQLNQYLDANHDGEIGSGNYYVAMYSEDTDSRIHSTTYEKGFSHVFGIVYASNGYSGDDNIAKAVKKIPAKVIKNYDTLAQPIMKLFKIKKKPKVIVFNQI